MKKDNYNTIMYESKNFGLPFCNCIFVAFV